ncbi:MAG: hypothetical protein AB7I27_19595 [Bacteriovoracaceae bacterium]
MEENHLKDLITSGFSESAQSIYSDKLSKVLFFTQGYGSNFHVKYILAAEISDLFGGMGSWNDQGFDSDEFNSVSTEMYRAIQQITLLAINSEE